MSTKAQVGAMSTADKPKKPVEDVPPAKPSAPAPKPSPKPAPAPDGNTPVDVQQTQEEHDRAKPHDQA